MTAPGTPGWVQGSGTWGADSTAAGCACGSALVRIPPVRRGSYPPLSRGCAPRGGGGAARGGGAPGSRRGQVGAGGGARAGRPRRCRLLGSGVRAPPRDGGEGGGAGGGGARGPRKNRHKVIPHSAPATR